MSEWQPIETAPKDGTQFIAYKEPDDMCNVPFWVIAKFVRQYDLMPYGQNYDEGFESDVEMEAFGIKAMVTSWNHKDIANTGFTHWMPLPNPPKV